MKSRGPWRTSGSPRDGHRQQHELQEGLRNPPLKLTRLPLATSSVRG